MDKTPNSDTLHVLDREMLRAPFEGNPGRVVRVVVALESEPDEVWRAMTTGAGLAQWVGDVAGEFREGGHFQVIDNASGRILRCEPTSVLRTDWDFGGSHSVVETHITRGETGSVLTLANAMPDVEDEQWALYGPGSAGVGWEIMLLALHHYLLTGQRFDDEQWVTTATGRTAIHDWSNAWADVHVRTGADKHVARTAGEKTAAFYLGEL